MATNLSNCDIKFSCKCLEEARAIVQIGQIYTITLPGPVTGNYKVLNLYCKKRANQQVANDLFISLKDISTETIQDILFFYYDPADQLCKPAIAVAGASTCQSNPISYNSIVYVRSYANDTGNSMIDRTYWRSDIDMSQITGGFPPYTIQGFTMNGPGMVNDTSIDGYDPTRAYNYSRRVSNFGPCQVPNCGFSVYATIQDSLGCTTFVGNTVNLEDMRCVGQGGDFVVTNMTSTTAEIHLLNPTLSVGQSYQISFNGFQAIYDSSATNNHTITGLTPSTTYDVMIRISCGSGQTGDIGPFQFTTLA